MHGFLCAVMHALMPLERNDQTTEAAILCGYSCVVMDASAPLGRNDQNLRGGYHTLSCAYWYLWGEMIQTIVAIIHVQPFARLIHTRSHALVSLERNNQTTEATIHAQSFIR